MGAASKERTRYFCVRCKRTLVNDATAKPPNDDTVTAVAAGKKIRFVHDQCDNGHVRAENG
jgi:hypothetical protein